MIMALIFLLPFFCMAAVIYFEMEALGKNNMPDFMGRQAISLLFSAFVLWVFLGSHIGIPVLIYGGTSIYLNAGGAVVPLAVSFYFIHNIIKASSLTKKYVDILYVSSGIVAVTALSYYITYLDIEKGIISEMPKSFLPAVLCFVLAWIFYGRNLAMAARYAYAIGALGVFLGADVIRLFDIIDAGIKTGSFGGAGIYDMVFTSGLYGMVLYLITFRIFSFFYKGNKNDYKTGKNEYKISDGTDIKIKIALKNIKNQTMYHLRNYQEHSEFDEYSPAAINGRRKNINYLEESSGHIEWIIATYSVMSRISPCIGSFILYERKLSEWILELKKYHSGIKNRVRKAEAEDLSLILGIREYLETLQDSIFAPVERRLYAFILDMIIYFFPCLLFYYFSGNFGIDMDIIGLAMLLLWAKIFYHTIFEFLFATTPGKKAFGLGILEISGKKPGIMAVFTRNFLRIAEVIFFFYVFSILVIEITGHRQRPGDIAANTVVIDTEELSMLLERCGQVDGL